MRNIVHIARSLAALYCMLPSSGCATDVLPYAPLTVSTGAPRDAAWSAARVAARSVAGQVNEWPSLHRLVVTTVRGDTRDVSEIRVLPDGALEVDVRTELYMGNGAFLTTDAMCAGYTWSRERALAERVTSNLTLTSRR